MSTSPEAETAAKPDPFNSPAVLLATLFCARRARDTVLERLVSRRLAGMGIRIHFGDTLLPTPAKGVAGD